MRKKDIIRMIRGSQPIFDQGIIDYLTKIGVGHYIGGHVDEWRWESEDSACWNMTNGSLGEIYRRYCKQ